MLDHETGLKLISLPPPPPTIQIIALSLSVFCMLDRKLQLRVFPTSLLLIAS